MNKKVFVNVKRERRLLEFLTSALPVDGARLLVGAQVAAETEHLHVSEMTLQQRHRTLGAFRQHVHPHRVTRRRRETDVQVA